MVGVVGITLTQVQLFALKRHGPRTRHNFGSKPAEKRARSCIRSIWNVRMGAGGGLSGLGTGGTNTCNIARATFMTASTPISKVKWPFAILELLISRSSSVRLTEM